MSPRAINMAGFTLLPVILAMSLIAAIAFLLNRDNGMNAGMVASQSDADRARYTAEAGLQAVNAIAQGKNCTGYTDLGTTAFGAHSFTATVNPKSGTPVTLTATATTAGGASVSLTRSNVVMHQPPVTPPTLQPGVSGSDTYIRSPNPTVNYGADASLSVQSGMVKALVGFDLSPIPAGSTILSAQLSLYHTAGGSDTVSAYRVTKLWTEGTGVAGSGATWTYNGINDWTAAGGDYDTAAGVAVALSANNTFTTWDLTAQTAAWIAGTQQNYGIALVAIGGGANSFVSSDYTVDIALRPKLDVTYALPCGWVQPVPPLQASQDTWINETSGKTNTNYGGSNSFTVTTATKKSGHGLVQFDLSSSNIPAGTKFTSATLRLWAGGFSPTTPPTSSILTVYPVLNYVPWKENGATWNTANGSSNSWGCGNGGGGCFDLAAPAASATLSSTFTPGGWVEWNVTALAQEWFDGVRLNSGVGVLMDPTSGSSVAFNSKDATYAPQYMPQLVITY